MHNPAYPDTDKTICLDFDGVIHDDNKGYHNGTIYGEPIKGTAEALKEISKHVNIVIQSTKARTDRPKIDGKTGVQLIWIWLDKWDLRQFITDVVAEKPPAFMYVDDKGYRFCGMGYLLEDLREIWNRF